jgi:hypothetical protein
MPDETTLARVRALLAQAEATRFPAEAEAFQTKAEALMARHLIDEAMLVADDRRRDGVVAKVVTIDNPYPSAKRTLLGAIATAFGCRTCGHQEAYGARVTKVSVVGFAADIDLVEALFTSLLVHATGAMLAAVPPPFTGVRAFRHAFLLEYAGRIRQRLAETTARARADAEAEAGTSVHPALRDRAAAVADRFAELFPHIQSARLSASATAGGAGRRAADTADLGQRRIRGQRALTN